MAALAGYARVLYAPDHKSAKVLLIGSTRDAALGLTYYFDGVAQSSNGKMFDASYAKPLKTMIVSSQGHKLVLDDVDFMWNAAPLPNLGGDYRNGQKGAIVEMFGCTPSTATQPTPQIAPHPPRPSQHPRSHTIHRDTANTPDRTPSTATQPTPQIAHHPPRHSQHPRSHTIHRDPANTPDRTPSTATQPTPQIAHHPPRPSQHPRSHTIHRDTANTPDRTPSTATQPTPQIAHHPPRHSQHPRSHTIHRDPANTPDRTPSTATQPTPQIAHHPPRPSQHPRSHTIHRDTANTPDRTPSTATQPTPQIAHHPPRHSQHPRSHTIHRDTANTPDRTPSTATQPTPQIAHHPPRPSQHPRSHTIHRDTANTPDRTPSTATQPTPQIAHHPPRHSQHPRSHTIHRDPANTPDRTPSTATQPTPQIAHHPPRPSQHPRSHTIHRDTANTPDRTPSTATQPTPQIAHHPPRHSQHPRSHTIHRDTANTPDRTPSTATQAAHNGLAMRHTQPAHVHADTPPHTPHRPAGRHRPFGAKAGLARTHRTAWAPQWGPPDTPARCCPSHDAARTMWRGVAVCDCVAGVAGCRWPYSELEQECADLGRMGYLGVKVFPPTEQVMAYNLPFNGDLNPWYFMYQPAIIAIICPITSLFFARPQWYFMYQPASYRLQGRMGTRDELRHMINTCRKAGVRIYADAVVNHMVGSGNDANPHHRNGGAGCAYWPQKNSSAPDPSPFYTQGFAYLYNDNTGLSPTQEFPAVPYGPLDFHCERTLSSWSDPLILNAGWLVGLADLNTEREYVQQRIADYFSDLMGIGFSGIRIDAAKHIQPADLTAIFAKFKSNMGGALPAVRPVTLPLARPPTPPIAKDQGKFHHRVASRPDFIAWLPVPSMTAHSPHPSLTVAGLHRDFIAWLEVLLGGEASLLMCDTSSPYNYGADFAAKMRAAGLTQEDVDKIKIWDSGYPKVRAPWCGCLGCVGVWLVWLGVTMIKIWDSGDPKDIVAAMRKWMHLSTAEDQLGLPANCIARRA
ncbi:putative alpha amylase domain protein [Paratrimastix pyriformis]|uniref:Alpha amylase domain protein n=1 Tax=Paratrimastix pyriformis TaxID=342808 RepID=A0ABQ8UBC4_9EUKA|nr:putative alpha amylase domain protein [Paratrimastix pyriformis]